MPGNCNAAGLRRNALKYGVPAPASPTWTHLQTWECSDSLPLYLPHRCFSQNKNILPEVSVLPTKEESHGAAGHGPKIGRGGGWGVGWWRGGYERPNEELALLDGAKRETKTKSTAPEEQRRTREREEEVHLPEQSQTWVRK